jgi:uncharacterized membrane protein
MRFQFLTASSFAPSRYAVLIGLATAIGAALRIAAANNDLWLDEIWSLKFAMNAKSYGDVLWGVSHDNNHILNTVWLRFTGPDAHPVFQRLPAILAGIATIPVAARIARAHGGDIAGVSAALLFAFSVFFVNYGSEARGYGVAVLASLLAADAVRRWLADSDDRLALGQIWASIALGALFHLIVVWSAAVIWIIATGALMRRGPFRAAFERSFVLGGVMGLGLAPAFACLLGGVHVTGTFRVATLDAFSLGGLMEGLASLLHAIVAVPALVSPPAWSVLAFGATFSAVCLALCPPQMRYAFATGLLAPPVFAIATGLRDPYSGRFHMLVGITFLLLLAVSAGRAWARGGNTRLTVSVFILMILFLNIARLPQLLTHGRGDYRNVISLMTANGPATWHTDFGQERRVAMVYHARNSPIALTPVEDEEFCENKPDWHIATRAAASGQPTITLGPSCPAIYHLALELPVFGSGYRRALYRRGQR